MEEEEPRGDDSQIPMQMDMEEEEEESPERDN